MAETRSKSKHRIILYRARKKRFIDKVKLLIALSQMEVWEEVWTEACWKTKQYWRNHKTCRRQPPIGSTVQSWYRSRPCLKACSAVSTCKSLLASRRIFAWKMTRSRQPMTWWKNWSHRTPFCRACSSKIHNIHIKLRQRVCIGTVSCSRVKRSSWRRILTFLRWCGRWRIRAITLTIVGRETVKTVIWSTSRYLRSWKIWVSPLTKKQIHCAALKGTLEASIVLKRTFLHLFNVNRIMQLVTLMIVKACDQLLNYFLVKLIQLNIIKSKSVN